MRYGLSCPINCCSCVFTLLSRLYGIPYDQLCPISMIFARAVLVLICCYTLVHVLVYSHCLLPIVTCHRVPVAHDTVSLLILFIQARIPANYRPSSCPLAQSCCPFYNSPVPRYTAACRVLRLDFSTHRPLRLLRECAYMHRHHALVTPTLRTDMACTHALSPSLSEL